MILLLTCSSDVYIRRRKTLDVPIVFLFGFLKINIFREFDSNLLENLL